MILGKGLNTHPMRASPQPAYPQGRCTYITDSQDGDGTLTWQKSERIDAVHDDKTMMMKLMLCVVLVAAVWADDVQRETRTIRRLRFEPCSEYLCCQLHP